MMATLKEHRDVDESRRAEPYQVFWTEEAYREHIGRIVGWRIGREQAKIAEAEQRVAELGEIATELRERVDELENETAEMRRESHTDGTPLHSREDGL